MGDAVGMMEGAYFVGRFELLAWLNDLLGLQYTKVEQCASGAAHCQVFDVLYPGRVPLHKVNFDARKEYEFIANYKVLQKVFDQLHIQRHIDVNKLIKGKYQDNLEFLQWVKCFFDRAESCDQMTSESYDGAERRKRAIEAYRSGRGIAKGGQNRPVPSEKAMPKVPVTMKENRGPQRIRPAEHDAKSASSEENGIAKEDYEKVCNELNTLKEDCEEIEYERDFYFSKLRDIEIECQMSEDLNLPIVQIIQKILYRTPEGERERLAAQEDGDASYSVKQNLSQEEILAPIEILTPRKTMAALPGAPTERPAPPDLVFEQPGESSTQDNLAKLPMTKGSSPNELNLPDLDEDLPNLLDPEMESGLIVDQASLDVLGKIQA